MFFEKAMFRCLNATIKFTELCTYSVGFKLYAISAIAHSFIFTPTRSAII